MRRGLIFIAGLLICVYGVAVIWYAQRANEIGLRCAFETEIQEVRPNHIKAAPNGMPRTGDLIVQIGPNPVRTWPDYLRTVADLTDTTRYVPARHIPASVSQEQLPAELEKAADNLVLWGDVTLVRVVFTRPAAEGSQAKTGVCWCQVGTPPAAELVPSILWFLIKLGLFAVGAVIYWNRPEDEAAKRFFILCIVTVGAFMGGYHWLRIAPCPWLVVVFMVCGLLMPVASLHFYLVFPKPKAFLERRPRTTLGVLYGIPGALLVAMLATYTMVVWTFRHGGDPETVTLGYRTLLLNEIYIYLGMAAVLFAGSVACLVHSFRHAARGSVERNQVKWLLVGYSLASLPIAYTLFLAVSDTDAFGLGAGTWPMFAASLCMTVAYGISLSRYRLMDVDKVLNWGLVYVAVSCAAALVYSGLVFAGTHLISQQIGLQSSFRQAALVGATALLLLICLDLFRWRLRKAIDRRLHRDKYQLDKTLRRMSEAVEQQVDAPTLSRRFLHALAELLGFQRGCLYLRDGNPPLYRQSAHLGEDLPLKELPPGSPLVDALERNPLVQVPASIEATLEPAQRQLALLGGAVAVPLRHERTPIAILLVGPRGHGRYGVEELHLLTTFAQIAALALHGAKGHQTIDELNRELQTKVEKISEQQRRISALQNQLLRQSNPPTPPPPTQAAAGGIVGAGPLIQQLLQVVKKVSASQSAVLIRGESGTGKELLARALHDNSPRAGKAFVKVHCAALSTGLLESELFGHVKGAFTGAHRDKVGRFEMANGGTLFLDEIGDISLEVQTKLLRVLQETTFERVGSSEPVKVDVRIIAATNQNLEQFMRDGRFREDLFYRLNVITMRTPPLRDRREDIVELAYHFLKIYADRNAKTVTHIDDEVMETLKAYEWPGNIRELENVIERAVVLADGPTLTVQQLPDELLEAAERDEPAAVPDNGNDHIPEAPFDLSAPETEWNARQEQRERDRLVRALAAAGGNKAQAARALGIPRSTLISKLEKFGLLAPRRRL